MVEPGFPIMSEGTNRSQSISSYQLMRWARQERSALMAVYLRSAASYLAASLRGYVRYFGELARRLAHELYLRSATRTLQKFDDRILADIGLRRGEIEHVVRNGRLASEQKQISTRTHSSVRLHRWTKADYPLLALSRRSERARECL